MSIKLEKLQQQYEEHCQRIIRSTQRAVANILKPELEKKYHTWFEHYFPHYAKSPCSRYHKRLAFLLINFPVIYIILRVFRGGAKSVHVNMGIPLYLYLVKKELGFMLLIGENETKAKKLLSDVQAEIQYNKRLHNDYGQRFRFGHWADGQFTTTDDVHFFSLGIGQSPRGIRDMEKRPDYISVDDVDTKKRSKNPKLVRELFEYLKEDIWGTFGHGKQRYVQANNRFSKSTVIQLMSEHFENVISEFKRLGHKVVHHIMVVKAITDKGESGWPEAFDLAYWEKQRIIFGDRAFQREFQDNPIEEGTVFKNDWINWKQRYRLDQYDALVVYGDLSYKEMGDYKALLLLGRKEMEFHVLAAFVRRSTRAVAASWLYDLYETLKLSKYNIKYLIEGSFAQDEFVEDFDAEGKQRGYFIPVVADKKSKANKHERIESMSGFFERGNVSFNAAERGTNDFNTLIDQILSFEKGSQVNDDGPDCLQSGIMELNGMGKPFNLKLTSRADIRERKKNRF